MKTMARMLRQRLSNLITELGRQAKTKAVLVNILIIVLASLIIMGVFLSWRQPVREHRVLLRPLLPQRGSQVVSPLDGETRNDSIYV